MPSIDELSFVADVADHRKNELKAGIFPSEPIASKSQFHVFNISIEDEIVLVKVREEGFA